MTHTSRRGVLAAFAASAATVPFGGAAAASPARATATAASAVDPAAASAAPAGLTAARSSVTLPPLNPAYFSGLTLDSALTATVLPGTPARTEVTSGGRRVALLTHGARSVLLPGPERTFTENKKPFVDDFARTLPDTSLPVGDRAYWGTSPGGGSWSTLGPVESDYAVVPGAGIITLTTDYASRHASLRDGEVTDVDVRSVARFDKVPEGDACSYALSFGYQDTHNNYRARLSFTTSGAVQLRVEKEVDDTVTQLAPAVALADGVPAGTDWTIRVRREGTRVRAKAWPSAGTEPSAWSFDVTDDTFGKGRVGLRALANRGCTNLPVTLRVGRFQVDAANWAEPPAVTHSDWVRVLPEPFDGVWTPQLEQVVRGWSGSPAPDVLAHAAMFLAGASPVVAGSGPAEGRQVMGEAGYGYLDPQGYRYEGADFHEYMGTGWTFPDGAHTGPSSRQTGNLDCSGYTRMVYGYHMGVPLAAGEDTSGTRLPRKSRDMADHSPGVRIARTDGTLPPPAEQLQPGDLVLFNADSGDDNAVATTDHVGIYLGADTAGRRRFLSSRKTVNGPTMSDLGGASLLDGTGTYARTLHTVHRI
ncbi:NlpC/P60 family protein [Streptomyces anthocyanicus]|uniref:NlpC/P60 family protein n=1 Tax=Streptomyces anthocyanicus TaxID=68174 RepID=UPI002DDC7CDD|nr:NlpC/P60 family protein [Streptomyces anthocyanicus]WSB61453.1 C40 family peptidase [Streptomyces anthocyanicus]WTE19148.1 C40 family peptidase [Streptomyces anthocyanicus]